MFVVALALMCLQCLVDDQQEGHVRCLCHGSLASQARYMMGSSMRLDACFIKLSVGYMSRMLRYLAFVVISPVLSFFLMLGSSPDVLPP